MLLLFAGAFLAGLILLDGSVDLKISWLKSWTVHRPLWGLIAAGLFGLGWGLQRQNTARGQPWKPGPTGRRFQRVVIYSRPECHLCDDAKALLAEYLDYLPDLEEVSIDADPALHAQYSDSIPVVEIDGEVRFRGRVDELLLRRLIEGTPPVQSVRK
ncbi:MAG: glutaredoxin family protein [Planctomycetales bacterium]